MKALKLIYYIQGASEQAVGIVAWWKDDDDDHGTMEALNQHISASSLERNNLFIFDSVEYINNPFGAALKLIPNVGPTTRDAYRLSLHVYMNGSTVRNNISDFTLLFHSYIQWLLKIPYMVFNKISLWNVFYMKILWSRVCCDVLTGHKSTFSTAVFYKMP